MTGSNAECSDHPSQARSSVCHAWRRKQLSCDSGPYLTPFSSFHIWGITPRETRVVLGDCRLISAMPFVNLKDASANYEVPYRHINVGHSIHAYDAKRAKRCRAVPLRSPSS